MARRIIDLNGDSWKLGKAPSGAVHEQAKWGELARVEEWYPARVPGNVRADLLRAGRLPGLALGTQVEAAQWVDDSCWWLVRMFTLDAKPHQRAHLVLRGVDYIGDLYLNGHHLGRHEGMFSPQIYDITELLTAGNHLAVRIVGSRWLPRNRSSGWEKTLNWVESRSASIARRYPHRRDTLKCQMGFGWDFAPALRTMGIWDDVYVVTSGDVFVRDVVARTRGIDDPVQLTVQMNLDALRGQDVRLRCHLEGETFHAEPVEYEARAELPSGSSQHTLEFPVTQARLWWPWDHGRPDLYRLTVEVWAGSEMLDSFTRTVGFRQIELDDWTVRVNGRPVYARGANWVPADILPGRVEAGDYQALLDLARQANMNMLRVWGGGLREKRAFYELCDRLGILVWQEFPFACAFLTRYPRTPAYLRLVDAEVRAILRDLRNHASVALWCGGNEFDPDRNRPLVETLEQAVLDEDPTRPFLPASPSAGDSHNWKVWHNFEPPSTYLQDRAGFASEFGLQAPPAPEGLRLYLGTKDLWPPGPSWTCHGADLAKLQRYARPFLTGKEVTLENWVRASQEAQARGLQIAIEHYRRSKAQGNGGVLVWQLNEPWPAISWALVEHARQPKPAYEMVRRLFQPTMISLEYALQAYQPGDAFHAELWVVHDGAELLPACQLSAVLLDRDGNVLDSFAGLADVAAFSAAPVAAIAWTLPAASGWKVSCQMKHGEQFLVENEYDLTILDNIQPTRRQRMWAWLVGKVTPG